MPKFGQTIHKLLPPALLKVEVRNLPLKRSILSIAKKLRNASSEQLRKVYITLGLSYQERMHQKNLRSELQRRKDAGESDLAVRRGQIVKLQGSLQKWTFLLLFLSSSALFLVVITRVGNTFSFTSVVTEPLFKKTTNCEHSFYSLDKALGTIYVLYTNYDQLINKCDELLTIVDDVKPDLVLLTEVIPKAQILPIGLPNISIPGFLLFTNFDPDLPHLGKSGYRRLAIYVADYLHPTQVTYHSVFKEHLWTSISLDNTENLLIGNIYRSPSSDKFTSTNELCGLINCVNNTKPSYLLIVGDFNYPNIDWHRGCLAKVDHSEQLFFDTIQDCVLFQLVMQPARFRQGAEPHILDLILTNAEAMIHNIKFTAGLGNSDHVCIQFGLNCTANRSVSNNIGYNYFKAD